MAHEPDYNSMSSILDEYVQQDPHLGRGVQGPISGNPFPPPGAYPSNMTTSVMDVDLDLHASPKIPPKRKATDGLEQQSSPSEEEVQSDTTSTVASQGAESVRAGISKRPRHATNRHVIRARQGFSAATFLDSAPGASGKATVTPGATHFAPPVVPTTSPNNPFQRKPLNLRQMGHLEGTRDVPPLTSLEGIPAGAASPRRVPSDAIMSPPTPSKFRSTNPFTRMVDKGKGRANDAPTESNEDFTLPATQADVKVLQLDMRELVTSFKGLGVAVTALVDQNAELLSVLRDRFTSPTGKQRTTASHSARNGGGRDKTRGVPDDEGAMDVDAGFDDGDDADDDDDERLPQPPFKKVSLPKKGLPRRRSPAVNALNAAIRVLTAKYMGRKGPDAPFNVDLLPSEEEAKDFDDKDGPCCSVEDFRPDLLATPASAWNQSVADVFVEGYLKEGSFPCDDEDLIRRHFRRHLKYLITKFNEDYTPEELKERLKERRRRERRSYLFQRRLRAVYRDPALNRHAGVLERLGPQGMSSDESATENGVKQFRILRKAWRNPILEEWLRVFDGIDREERDNPITGKSRGAEARSRFTSGRVDNSTPPVIGLPANAYSGDWLSNLTKYQRDRLRVQPEYDFTHTAEVRVRANERSGKHNVKRAPRFR